MTADFGPSTTPHTSALQPGFRFGPYGVIRKVGEGGMGAIWEGTHEALKKRVAIKTLHQGIAGDPEAVARFLREGQAAARIHHAHVVDVTDVGVHDGTPYLVMEYLDGETLADRLRHGPIETSALVDIALPVMDALTAAHAEGVVHRDLKPENIFLKRARGGSHPMLLDFGISKVVGGDARLTKTSAFMGTPYYMSPEQARGAKNVDARSDQFSLGLVLYEAASGRRAIDGDSVLELAHKIATGDFATLDIARPDLPAPFRAAVWRMTRLDPADRFGSMTEAAAALLPLASPRTQAVWAGMFTSDSASRGDIGTEPTRLASAPHVSPPVTTFRRASFEVIAPPSPPRRLPLAALLATGLGAIALVGVGIVATRAPTPRTISLAAAAPSGIASAAPIASAVPAPIARADVQTTPTTVPIPPAGIDPTLDAIAVVEPPRAPHAHAAHTELVTTTHAATTPTLTSHPPVAVSAPTTDALADAPSRDQVTQVLAPLAGAVSACGDGARGTLVASIVVTGATGHVRSVTVSGEFAGTAVASCATRALSSATFPHFRHETFSVTYPYRVSGSAILR